MILKNHIAYRFLTDEELIIDMIEAHMPGPVGKIERGEKLTEDESSQMHTLNKTLSFDGQEAFYITNTIIDKLDMLKVKPKGIHFDWTIFDNIPDQKKTFIYPNGTLIRFCRFGNHLCFCWVVMSPSETHKGKQNLNYHLFHYNQTEKRFSSNWNDEVLVGLEERIYKLLCFFYFSENETIVVEPGRKYGTLKQGKLINTFKNIPITIVNSNWNVTSIRTEGFGVRGHFRLQRCGVDNQDVKMIFIEPFTKNGYVRRAKNEEHI